MKDVTPEDLIEQAMANAQQNLAKVGVVNLNKADLTLLRIGCIAGVQSVHEEVGEWLKHSKLPPILDSTKQGK